MINRLAFGFYRVLSAGLKRLSIATVFRIGWALGTAAYFIAKPYRQLVLANLKIAFGREKSPAQLRQLARRHFASLGANLLSSIKLPTLSRAELEAIVTVEGMETMEAGVREQRGFTMIVSHFGNWEMFAQLTPHIFPCPVGSIYQRLSNPLLDAELRRDRAQLGLRLFERKEGFTEAMKYIRAGGAVGILADQHAGDAGLWCPLFDRLASTSTLAATLALRTNSWLVPAALYTDGIGRWRCVIFDRIPTEGQSAEALTARINETLEAQIRQQPSDWFWVHNRWKTPRPKFLLATYKRGIAMPATTEKSLQPFKILIRSSNWLGDAVMSAPAVRAIKRGRPDAHITLLTPAKLADFWRSLPEVDAIIPIEPSESVFAVAAKIRDQFEAAIIFPNSLRTALEAYLAGIPRRVGYPGHHRSKLLNQVLREKKKKKGAPENTAPKHQVHHYLALAQFIGAEIPDSILTTQRQRAPRANPVIGICPGAEYGPAKRWLPERFAEVMRDVHQRRGAQLKLFGVAKDRPVADEILGATPTPCTDLVGKTTLTQLIDELLSCDLLLSNDTGTMHLAACLGVPVVALFGSTEPVLTGPLGSGHRILRHPVECSPCFKRECPIDFRCMKAIQASEVLAAIDEILDPQPEAPAPLPPPEI